MKLMAKKCVQNVEVINGPAKITLYGAVKKTYLN